MRITRFSGLLDAASRRHKSQGAATVALNTRTTDGSLRAIRAPKLLGSCAQSYVLDDAGGYSCGDPCSVSTASSCGGGRIGARGGVLINTEDGTALIPPRPTKPAIQSLHTGETTTAFRVAALSSFGGISPLSEVSAFTPMGYGQTVRLDTPGPARVYALLPAAIDGSLPQNGEASAQWVVVGDFDTRISFTFDPETWALSEDAPGDEQCAPTGVSCVTRDELGYYYTWSRSEVWISEKNSPEVWPARGYLVLEHNIVHAVQLYDMLLVVTDGKPFLVRANPNNDGTLNPVAIPYSAHHGVIGGVDVISPAPLGIIYPARAGLIALTGQAPNGYQLLTRGVVNQEEWQRHWLPKALGEHHGVVVTDRWVLDIPDTQHGNNPLNAFHTHNFPVERVQSLPDGRLLVFAGGMAYEWGAGAYAEAVYESEEIVEQGHRVHTACKIVGQNLAGVRFELIDSDTDEVIHTEVLEQRSNNVPFRIRACRGQHYRIRLTLPSSEKEIAIFEAHVAPDINDLTRPEGTAQ